jgi:hypothetical protein
MKKLAPIIIVCVGLLAGLFVGIPRLRVAAQNTFAALNLAQNFTALQQFSAGISADGTHVETIPAVTGGTLAVLPTSSLVPGLTAPNIVADVNLTAQTGNIGTLLYAVPVGGTGQYYVTCYVVLTQAATSSSTMPACSLSWNEGDTNVSANLTFFSGGSASNTVGANETAFPNVISARASTNIFYSTTGYGSVGATPMQYAIHLRLIYLGT